MQIRSSCLDWNTGQWRSSGLGIINFGDFMGGLRTLFLLSTLFNSVLLITVLCFSMFTWWSELYFEFPKAFYIFMGRGVSILAHEGWRPIPRLEYNPCRADMVKPNVKKIYALKMIFKVLDPRRRPCRSYDPPLNIYKKRTREKEKGIQNLTLVLSQYTCTLSYLWLSQTRHCCIKS